MQTIIPHIWFDRNAEDAVRFYTSIFENGVIHSTTRYPEAGFEVHGMPAGTVLTQEFEIEGLRFVALNGGPHFKPNPSISFMINFDPSRESAAEERLNALWKALADGGIVRMELGAYPFSKRYGWVEDKYGVSWQLILTDPEGDDRPRVLPSLLFVGDVCGKAGEAIDLYVSVFHDARRGATARYGAGMEPDKEGTIMFADFMLENQWFAAMDSAHEHAFSFNEALSLLVLCDDQAEIDRLWEALSAVPEAEQCGWIKDKYGVSWQIVPKGMEAMLNDPDREKADRAMNAMLKMKKIDVEALTRAYEGV